MEWIHTEDKSGYKIMHNDSNEQYIVIDGLDPDNIHNPGAIESFMVQHYGAFALAYWLLLALTFTFLILRHIVLPLYERFKQGRPLFVE